MIRIDTVISVPVGGPCYSSFHFTGDDQESADIAAAKAKGFWLNAKGAMHLGCVVDISNEATLVDDVTLQPTGTVAVAPYSGAGGAAGDMLPLATQLLVKWRTSSYLNGRRLQGKTYVPGMTEQASTDGTPNTFPNDHVLGGIATILTPGAGAALVVTSRTHLAASPVISGAIWDQFAVLRSRRQ